MIVNRYDLRKVLGIVGASRMQSKLRAVIEPKQVQMQVPRILADGTKQMAIVWLDHYDLEKTIEKSKEKTKACHHRWRTRFEHRTEEIEELKKKLTAYKETVKSE